jgi:hypothetical protein
VDIFFPGTKLFVFSVLPRAEQLNQDDFLAAIAPELSKESSHSKRKVDKGELIVQMGNRIGARSKDISPEKDEKNPSSSLFSRSAAV